MNRPRSRKEIEDTIKTLKRFPRCIINPLLKADEMLKDLICEQISFCEKRSHSTLESERALQIFSEVLTRTQIERKVRPLALWTSLHISLKIARRESNLLSEMCSLSQLPMNTLICLECFITQTLNWNLNTPTLIYSIQQAAALFGNLDPETVKYAQEISLEFYKHPSLWGFSFLEASVTCLLFSIRNIKGQDIVIPRLLDSVKFGNCFEALSSSVDFNN